MLASSRASSLPQDSLLNTKFVNDPITCGSELAREGGDSFFRVYVPTNPETLSATANSHYAADTPGNSCVDW